MNNEYNLNKEYPSGEGSAAEGGGGVRAGGCTLRATQHPPKCCPEVAGGKAGGLEKIWMRETGPSGPSSCCLG